MAEPITSYVLTPHALFEMEQRGILESVVNRVLTAPEQRINVRPARDVLQSRIPFSDGMYLVRVFVDVDCIPAEVVTIYRTSKMEKYWEKQT
jgi:Domain of unknown function (DUF4258)